MTSNGVKISAWFGQFNLRFVFPPLSNAQINNVSSLINVHNLTLYNIITKLNSNYDKRR